MAVLRGRPGWLLLRNSSSACASGRFSRAAAFTRATSFSNGTSTGIVAKSMLVSADTESGGVSVAPETATRVQTCLSRILR